MPTNPFNDETKMKSIRVVYLPELGMEDVFLETTGKVGYRPYGAENGSQPNSYLVYADAHTTIVPMSVVARVEVNL